MDRLKHGFIAGLIATVVLSVLMLLKGYADAMPRLDVIKMLANMLGAPGSAAVGWVAHFLIGTIAWGGLFALVSDKLPGPYWARGILFGLGAWVLMMVIVMPVAGAGLFAMKMGVMAAVLTALLHMIFGAALGMAYVRLAVPAKTPPEEGP